MIVFFLFVFFITNLTAQESMTIISISPFYTHGKYSNEIDSDSKALYGTLNLDGDLISTFGIDLISLKHNNWDYKQNTYYLSFTKKISDYYVKISGALCKGDYLDNKFSFLNYQDKNFSFTTEFIYKYNWQYYGVGFNYFNSSKGWQIVESGNLTLRYEAFLDYYNYLSVRPNIYLENKGKKLISISSKFIHWFNSDFLANISLTIGKRKYYFDNDLLTIYNQYETQKFVFGVALNYSLFNYLTISSGYQHKKFEEYNVNYFFLGFRSEFFL
ncbi:MAG: hypothetical protein NZM09_05435 [Ignavibacterium sp.]|nr:hypothetical protein [Ignavibacterium sp.]MDW8375119.1 hypothetical protein [Ignavibacteriales bacterium]